MKILVAEDDQVTHRVLTNALSRSGYDVVPAFDGAEAWAKLERPGAPSLVICDWMMPEIDGIELIRRLRARPSAPPTYVMLLTARLDKASVVAGLEAGANDYLTKPVDLHELRARVQVGRDMVQLQTQLAARVRELEQALKDVRALRGLLPICCYCKKIRDDQDYWQEVESYLGTRADVHFSHGVCPNCSDNFLAGIPADVAETGGPR